MRPPGLARGFTLVELMVVVTIVGVMATLGFAALNKRVTEAGALEALSMVQSIRAAQERWRAEHLHYLDVSQDGDWQPRDPTGVGDSAMAFFSSAGGVDSDAARWILLNPVTRGPMKGGYMTTAGLAGEAMTAPSVDVGVAWPDPTDSWYVIEAVMDNDADGTVSYYLAGSLTGEVLRHNEGE